jgi:hypothetical protein
MKKIISNILLIFTVLKITAQAYVPFQFGATRWQYQESFFSNTKYNCYFSIDTVGKIINGKKYLSIQKNNMPIPNGKHYSYLYDDTAQRKVYFYDSVSATENLLYNFAANEGDTLQIKEFMVPNSAIIADSIIIDSIVIKTINTIPRKFFYFKRLKGWGSFNYYIEGIGSNNELFAPTFRGLITDPDMRLDCMKYGGATSYPDTLNGLNKCTLVTGLKNNLGNFKDYFVLPNPSKNGVFYLNVKASSQWQVFNMIGAIVASGNSNEINLINNNSGIYFLKIIDDENNFCVQKIVKE